MGWYQKYVVPYLLRSSMSSGRIAALRPAVIAEAKGTVLEIGSGPGYNFPLYRGITKLYALEPSKELAASSQTRAAELPFPIEYLLASAEKIPLPDSSIDTVVSTWTLCSVEDPAKVLSEIARILRPGGRLVCSDHGLSPILALSVLQRLLTPVTKHFTGNCHMDRPIKKLIEEAGFTFSTLEEKHGPPKWLMYNTRASAMLVK